jgi:serine/threonine protein kinase/ankyrin repeat protein
VYARKRIKKKRFGFDKKAAEIYENEIQALKKVADHHHLIKVRGTYTDRKFFVMLLEPAADENLKEYMNRGGPRDTQEQTQFRSYFGCLAHTIRFLHAQSIGMIHKDIKPENILVKNGHLILTDFGTAFDWSQTGQSMTRSNANDVRTPRYQSPEVAHAGEFHRSSDIWSLGVVFLEMVTILRGKTLKQMDEFLITHGRRVAHIYDNLDAALNWFEPLQEHQSGDLIDNEPLSWIKAMLNNELFNRLTADELYDTIAALGNRFCGSCCFDADSDSDSDDDYDEQSGPDVFSDGLEICGQPPEPHHEGTSGPEAFQLEANSGTVPGSFPEDEDGAEEEIPPDVPAVFMSLTKEETYTQRDLEINQLPGSIPERVHIPKKTSRAGSRASSVGRDTSRGQGNAQTGLSGKARVSPSKTAGGWVRPDSFPERESFKKWLAALPAALQVRSRTVKTSGRPTRGGPSIGSQRMNHFLSSLPEEVTEFVDVSDEFSAPYIPKQPTDSSAANLSLPIFSNRALKHSQSFENFESSSRLLQEDADNSQFSDMPRSRLVHYASASNLNLELELSKEDLQEATEDLKNFKPVIASPALKIPQKATSAPSANRLDPEVNPPVVTDVILRTSAEPTWITPWAGQLLQNSLRESRGQPSLARLTPFPETTTKATPASSVSAVPVSLTTSAASSAPKVPPTAEPRSLRSFIAVVPTTRRRQWESASVIMKRIMNDEASVALTSEMSVNTRALVSKGRFVMRWNDKVYHYLPYFVAQANVGGVRNLLMAGCNPGTVEKPRWGPVYNAVMGRTQKHIKCLKELATYGADVNAIRASSGRTFLHYAIEHEPWSGYSTVIHVLLTAGVDPNVRDHASDIPLLMLLVGNGPLPQEKRDALYRLLAPNFNTDLDVSIQGTLDNPLHLAIRRKDAYTLDALLTKMITVSSHMISVLQLMHNQNGSGFTPILLAFKLFNFTEDADDELQIIKLLLENGADPNDQDATQGHTPLHLVILGSKNTVALELLCRHSADPRKADKSGKCPIDLAHKGRTDHPSDRWYHFAERRMDNRLKGEHYRPPELVALLAEEAERAVTVPEAAEVKAETAS